MIGWLVWAVVLAAIALLAAGCVQVHIAGRDLRTDEKATSSIRVDTDVNEKGPVTGPPKNSK